jgi:hypothetical protein
MLLLDILWISDFGVSYIHLEYHIFTRSIMYSLRVLCIHSFSLVSSRFLSFLDIDSKLLSPITSTSTSTATATAIIIIITTTSTAAAIATMPSSDIFGIRSENLSDVAPPSTASATAFNPFDALGVTATAMTAAMINTTWRRAHSHFVRAATAPLFPVAAEINAARDYLRDATATPSDMATAVRTWAGEPRTFFAERPLGDAGAFTATAATAAIGPTPLPASASTRARPRPRSRSASAERPRKSARTANATRATRSNAPGTSAANPVSLDSSPEPEDDDDDEDEDDDDDDDDDDGLATPPPGATAAPSSACKPTNRSGGGSARAAAADNPDNTLEIVVGEWRQSTATPRNAVIARLDARGRLNFRVVARTMGGAQVAGPTATATSYPNIILAGTYAGMTYNNLRPLLIQQLSRRRQLGP